MNIDIHTHELLRLQDVPKRLPRLTRNRPVHVGTVRRWALTGKNGIKLATLCLGRVRITSVEALEEFFRVTSSNGSDEPVRLQRPTARMRAETASILQRAGLLDSPEGSGRHPTQRGRETSPQGSTMSTAPAETRPHPS
jgi:hypothetical protein